jgi:hypothetical protein
MYNANDLNTKLKQYKQALIRAEVARIDNPTQQNNLKMHQAASQVRGIVNLLAKGHPGLVVKECRDTAAKIVAQRTAAK